MFTTQLELEKLQDLGFKDGSRFALFWHESHNIYLQLQIRMQVDSTRKNQFKNRTIPSLFHGAISSAFPPKLICFLIHDTTLQVVNYISWIQ